MRLPRRLRRSARSADRRRRAAALAAVAPLALGSVVLSRFDFWPAALAVLALAAVLRRHRLGSLRMLLGTAFAAKLWPVVLVPLVVVWLVRTDGGRAAAALARRRGRHGRGVVPAVRRPLARRRRAQLPCAVRAAAAAREPRRGVLIACAPRRRDDAPRRRRRFGSQNLTGPGAHAVAIVTTIAGRARARGCLHRLRARPGGRRAPRPLHRGGAVAVTLAFGKVFSPQFLIWLVPFVPLVRGRRGSAASGLLLRRSCSRSCGSRSTTGRSRTASPPRSRASCSRAISRSSRSRPCSRGRG